MRHSRKKNAQQAPTRRHSSSDGAESYAFRRSRTITGSATDAVRAATEDRSQLRSPRLHEHSLRKHRRKLSAYLLACAAASGALLYVIMAYIGGTVSVGTSGAQALSAPIDAARYQPLVDRYFSERPFEQFTFTLNEESFKDFMVANASEVHEASLLKADGFGEVDLVLKLREPVVSWTIQAKQYFVDADGVAFERNYFATPTVTVVDNSGVNAELGTVTSSRLLHYIARVITLVGASSPDAPIVSVELPPGSTREVQFRLKDREYVIKANLDRDPAGQAMDITNVMNYIQAKGITPAYVDVRVASKAFYKDR